MVDLPTVALSVLGAGGTVWAGTQWFAGRVVDHQFAKRLEDHKAELADLSARSKSALDADYAAAGARLEADLKRATETVLGEEAADRSYRFEARKRLYAAIGPLRFQLVNASVGYVGRIVSLGRFRYSTSVKTYYGRSVLMRLGRLLALTELIDRQLAYADFSVDPSTIRLLRFREQLHRCLSSSDVPLDHPPHPDVDWVNQREHMFRDEIPLISIQMIVAGGDKPDRVVRPDEFIACLDEQSACGPGYLEPLTSLIDAVDPDLTSIMWLRLLAIAEVCMGFIDGDPAAEALGATHYFREQMFDVSRHPHLIARRADYLAMLETFRQSTLGSH